LPTLLFVYNADDGPFNLLAGLAHKVFSPATYPCRLCSITHGPLGMRADWKAFLDGLDRPIEFLHRDQFHRVYGMDGPSLPAIFRKDDDGRVEPLVDAATINAARSIDDLKRILSQRLEVG